MCGLAGIIRFDHAAIDRAALQRMSATLVHRGPDGEGEVIEGPVGMAHPTSPWAAVAAAG